MSHRHSWATLLAAALAQACSGEDPIDSEEDAGVDSGPEEVDDSGRVVFDETVLHEIVIEVDPTSIEALESDHENRISCTFTFDGTTLYDVGIRQKGQGTSSGSLSTKPSFSVKFDEFVDGQELDGIDKLVFQNSSYDPTLMNEAMGYYLYRESGIAAPRTSHGVITLLGMPGGPQVYGVHVIVEGVNKNFLRHNFGRDNDDGNLYEDDARGDFGSGPLQIDLKDEEEGRTREHLVELSNILNQAAAPDLVAQLLPILDLEVATKGWAIDVVTGNWDGFWTASHNYYIYDNPADGRFVLMPHGMDLLFGGLTDFGPGACLEFTGAASLLGRRFLEVPDIMEMAQRARNDLFAGPWNPDVMEAKIQNLTDLLEASEHDEPAFIRDREAHQRTAPRMPQVFRAFDGQLWEAPGVCGNGTLERAQVCEAQCDDGNLEDGDGCSSLCVPEICGDGIIQAGIGEVCENMDANCNPTCTGFITCGDGRTEGPEACDDGNALSDDGCSERCALEICGDGITQPGLGEGCDGENRCRRDCSGFIPCGDGLIEFPEYCDDGNLIDEDGCTNECEARCQTVQHGGLTFDLCTAETSFELAAAICSHLGSHRAVPRNVDEDEWLRTETQALIPGAWWIGVADAGNEWRTTEGLALPFTAWSDGEPSAAGECGTQTPEGWTATDCAEPHPVVCSR